MVAILPRRSLVFAVTASLLTGCATIDTVRDAPLAGVASESFDASYDRTNAATLKALSGLNITITSATEGPAGTTYLVTRSVRIGSWGEVGRVFVGKATMLPTTVYINWQKRDQMQLTGTSQPEFAKAVFDAIFVDLLRA